MEPSELLRQAVKAVEDAEVPDDLRVAAFERAVELLSGLASPGIALVPARSSAAVSTASAVPGGLFDQAAQRLGVPREVLEDVFHTDGDEIGIGLAASRFDKSKSGGTRQLALLVAAARQAAGLEEWTSTGVIREVCRDYGKFDSANFASTIRGMGDVFNFRGRGHQLDVKLTRPGYERAGELLQGLTSA